MTINTLYSKLIFDANPVSYWRLGEAAPTDSVAVDEMGQQNGTYVGTQGTGTDLVNEANGAMSFDVRNIPPTAYVSIASNAVLDITGDLTIECWVMCFDSLGGCLYDSGLSGGSCSLNVGQNSFNGRAYPYIGFAGDQYPTQFDASTWPLDLTLNLFHVMAVISGTTYILYLNGNAVFSGTFPSRSSVTATRYIGRDSGNFRGFMGRIDEVAIYNTALTYQQARDHYNVGSTGKLAGPDFPIARGRG